MEDTRASTEDNSSSEDSTERSCLHEEFFGDSYDDHYRFGSIHTSFSNSLSEEERDFSCLDQFLGEYVDLSYDNLCMLKDREIRLLSDITSDEGYYTPRTEKDELGIFDILPEELLLCVLNLVDDGRVLYKLADNFPGFNRLINLPGVLGHSKAKVFASCLGLCLELNIEVECDEFVAYTEAESSDSFLAYVEGNFYTERLDKYSKAYYNLKHNLSYFDENPLPVEDEFQLMCIDNITMTTFIEGIEVFAKYGAYIVLRECLALSSKEKKRTVLEVLSRWKITQREFILFILLTYSSSYTKEVRKITEINDTVSFTSTELISFYEKR